MNQNDLTIAILSRLHDSSADTWDADALPWVKNQAEQNSISEKQAERAWQDALRAIESTKPDLYDLYLEARGIQTKFDTIPWEEVRLLRGSEDGETYHLTFDVGGTIINIDCSYLQLKTPDYILDRLQFGARHLIDCPYKGKKHKDRWLPGVVFKEWLGKMAHADKASTTDMVKEAIVEFASKPIWLKNFDGAFGQVKEPVRDADTVYIPIVGLERYIKKMFGMDKHARMIGHTLLKMGANKIRKGVDRNTFYALQWKNLEAEQPRVGKDNTDPRGSEIPPASGWDRLSPGLRQEERAGNEAENRVATGIAKGQAPNLDDPRSSVPSHESDERELSDNSPF